MTLKALPKLVVQVPCLNEEETLPAVIRDIPREISSVGVVELQVIDDGSTDRTSEIAKELGVEHVVRNRGNKGLARSFQIGIDNALAQGADIIVNTDGDNQYSGASIPDLIAPILAGKADVVVGDRKPGQNQSFSPVKRILQRVGSRVVSGFAGLEINDAVSGFRAYSRYAALHINVMTKFSYTTETLIHAGQTGLSVVTVPVEVNQVERPSRLFKSMRSFISRQMGTILRSYVMYRPLKAFATIGLVLLLIGIIPIARFVFFYLMGDGDGKVQSLVLGGAFVVMGYFTIIIAILSETIATNRRLLEATLRRVRELEQRAEHADRA